ncbi:MAG: hypothetical protein QXE96_02875 [Candidatus Caldarchaeum sp.]
MLFQQIYMSRVDAETAYRKSHITILSYATPYDVDNIMAEQDIRFSVVVEEGRMYVVRKRT